MMAIGVYALLKAGQTFGQMMRRVPPARRCLRPLLKAWIFSALFFLVLGHFVYMNAPRTADLFSTPVIMVGVAGVILLWLASWLRKRILTKKTKETNFGK